MQINKLLWLVPFISFVLGYELLNQLYRVSKINTPNLVGKKLSEALHITSSQNLNLRILNEKIDADLPADTIISQIPTHHFIKSNQTMFVVIAKKPDIKIMPDLHGNTNNEIQAKLNIQNLKTKSYYLPNIMPKEYCFGQSPAANQPLSRSHKIITYLSQGNSQLVIMPKLVDLNLANISSMIETYKLQTKLTYHPSSHLPENYILAQKPESGAIINLEKLTLIELYVVSNPS